MKTLWVIGVLIIIGFISLRASLYIVDESEQVIILRFDEVILVEHSPGLYTKAPFVDLVVRFDRRILRIDPAPESIPDIEKQNLVIDSYARYRIVDPIQFRKTLQNESFARSRLGDIVNSTLRGRVALRDRFEIIGSRPVLDERDNPVVDADGVYVFEGRETRTALLDEMLQDVRRRVAEQNFGIEIIDVRIKRVDFTDQVIDSIYNRMRAEQNQIASRFRAQGAGEDLSIRAEADAQRAIILAEAQREANNIAAETEARVIDTYIQALARDTRLFRYQESLEAYKISKGLAVN